VVALAGAAVSAIAIACGPGDLSDLTAGRVDAGAALADARPDAAPVCIHASGPERPPPTAEGPSVPAVLFAFQDIRFDTGEQDGGPPRPLGLDLDRTCTCPEPESCVPAEAGTSGMARPCDGDGGRDNVAGALLTIAASGASGVRLDAVRDQLREGYFGMFLNLQAWNGQPDDPNVIVGFQLSTGLEGVQLDSDAGRPLPKFDGSDVWTLTPSSVLGGGDLIGSDCRKLVSCTPAKGDAMGYVRDGMLVAHLDIPLPVQTATGTFTIDFVDATVLGKLTQEGGVPRIIGEISGRWPVERLLTGFARIRNPQTDIALCASDAGLEIYRLIKQSVCESADLAVSRSLDRTSARCEALSNAFSFEGVGATAGTIFQTARTEPNDCPDFKDGCN